MIKAGETELNQVDDLMQKLISKLQIINVDSKDIKRLEDVCYDILYEIEQHVQGIK